MTRMEWNVLDNLVERGANDMLKKRYLELLVFPQLAEDLALVLEKWAKFVKEEVDSCADAGNAEDSDRSDGGSRSEPA
jgi:hypothetical protein